MIGLDCESGNFEDCLVDSELIGRNDCKGVLVFADVTSSCGLQCGLLANDTTQRNEKIIRSGWTDFTRCTFKI